MINTDKIKGRMRELRITQKNLAEQMKLAQPTVNQKINNLRPMNVDEAEILCVILKITSDEFNDFFFWSKSCTMQRERK